MKMRPHPRPTRTQPRQKFLDGDRTEARCGGHGLRCVRHEWVPVVLRSHDDDGCNKRHGAAVCPAAGQAACFGIMFHGPWTWANNLSVKVQAQVCQNIFFWGRVWDDLDKFHTKQCIFMMVWKRCVVIFLAHPIPLSRWNGHMQPL